MKLLLLSVLLLPLAGGVLSFILKPRARRGLLTLQTVVLSLEAVLVTVLVLQPEASMVLFSMTDKLVVAFRMDDISRLFLLIAAWGFLLAGVFAFRYLDHSENEGAFPEKNFYGFFQLSLAALVGMDLAANVISMYFFFEMITLCSMPLVLHERTKEATAAALKYLFYSIAGAFLALGCLFVVAGFAPSLDFAAGGYLAELSLTGGDVTLLRIMALLGIIGFGAKAGLYPLHGWLPSAHPVAPAPASAVLSAIIAKAGALAILRVLYFWVGPQFLAGSWGQSVLLALALLTVFMGSMMAYREKVLKKRLAYSSISQISYVLFGFFLLSPEGLEGGLMQVLFHAIVKICLFLVAGSIIYNTGYHRVDELKGLGRSMPKTFGAFTAAALSLIGIPPFAGFVSKWNLALASLDSGLAVYNWLGPVILLVSALLTAAYLLPISVDAFFPGKDFAGNPPRGKKEGGPLMVWPLLILAALSLLLGICSGWLSPFFERITALF